MRKVKRLRIPPGKSLQHDRGPAVSLPGARCAVSSRQVVMVAVRVSSLEDSFSA